MFDDYEESDVEGHEQVFHLCFGNIEQQIQDLVKLEYDIFKPKIEESQQEQISHGSQIKECIATYQSRYGSHVFEDPIEVYMESN